MDINRHMNTEIKGILKTAAGFYAGNQSGRGFLASFLLNAQKKAGVRNKWVKEGTQIPPFLIASVASQCNLRCSGCYAIAEGACSGMEEKTTDLSTAEWESIFREADTLGVLFIMLAGGEPFIRSDVIALASNYKNIIFPVFTNGTLLEGGMIETLSHNRNLVPIISIEGGAKATDKRRGAGTYEKIEAAMASLCKENILFGASITVTKENYMDVTAVEFIERLKKKGCGVVFYVEYVPADENTQDLVLEDKELGKLEQRTERIKSLFDNLIVISFPGDEEMMGGCLAAGRGFFHINASGGAEPCPFSPYSNMSLKENSMVEILGSDFFRELRNMNQGEEHQGGCTLFNKRQKVAALLV